MKLYHYDHCPYCVKARMIFGLKNIPFELEALLNDDVDTPTRMIGKKMVPILQKDDGSYMAESMEIVHYVDAIDGAPILTGKTNAKIEDWLTEARTYLYPLAMPRWVKAPLEEFATQSARDFFTRKKEAMIGPFDEVMLRSDALIKLANLHLKTLEPLIQSPGSVNGQLSEDDIHLFATLRSLSIVKGLRYPDTVEAYRQNMSQTAGILLHDDVAIGEETQKAA